MTFKVVIDVDDQQIQFKIDSAISIMMQPNEAEPTNSGGMYADHHGKQDKMRIIFAIDAIRNDAGTFFIMDKKDDDD